ncbi:10633_t:CDS:2, partial [Racocetra fulgida]
CYGSTGPSSIDPSDGERYATRFPILTIFDMVRAQFLLLDHLGINKLHAVVGSSMGGMQSLASAWLYPERMSRIVSISGCARSHPYSIAIRHTQRQEDQPPALCPDFLIETYLDYQGERFCLQYDPNSLLYISKAMDLFDMSSSTLETLNRQREINIEKLQTHGFIPESSCYANANTSREIPVPQPASSSTSSSKRQHISSLSLTSSDNLDDLVQGLSRIQIPTLVLGVQSDILFAYWQQREIADCLRRGGNKDVTYYELDSMYGHDTFLIDLTNVGGAIKGHLELG